MRIRTLVLIAIIGLFCSCEKEVDLSDGLIAYYTFDGDADDYSGAKGDGIIYGATLSADRFGNENSAFHFNGINSYIWLPAKRIINLNSYSYCVWIKPEGIPSNYSGMVYSVGDSVAKACQAFVYQPTSTLFAGSYNCCNNPLQSYSRSGEIKPDQWLFIVVTRDLDNIRMYINKTEVRIQPESAINNQPAFYGNNRKRAIIGGRSNLNYDSFFKGIIDDIRIYDRVLGDNEIEKLYELN